MDAPDEWSRWLKRLRADRELTQEQLAERAGCSVETIRALELGRRRPSRPMAEQLAKVLEVAPEQRLEFVRLARSRAQLAPYPSSTDPPAAQAPADRSPLHDVPPRPVRLPVPPTPLIGRAREAAEVERRLVDPQTRLVTLVGAGGTGKTRLALQVAADLSAQFPDGAAWVALAPIIAPEHVATALVDALSCPVLPAETPEAAVVGWLRDRAMLLVLDNLEHLLDVTPLLAAILGAAPGVRLLVTSRERLRLQGEWVFPLEGLSLPPDETRAAIERSDAVLLFAERARQHAGEFALTASNRAAIAHICRLLDGMPLGIELASAWVRVLEPAEIAVELTRSLDFLEGSDRDIDPRHRSVRAVIGHSWTLLTPDQQGILARLGVFRGGCRREAAETVAGATLPMLAALLDKSLLRRTSSTTPTGSGVPRYELHELVRQYGAEQLQAVGIADATARQHCEYYLRLSRTATEQAHNTARTTLVHLAEEQDNLRAALRWSAQSDVNLALQLVVALYWFWVMRGPLTEAWAASTQVLEAAAAFPPEAVDPALHTQAIAVTAGFALAQGRIDAALPLLEDNLQRFRSLGDVQGTALTLKGLGWVALEQGCVERAMELLEESLALYEQVGDRSGMGWVMENLATVAVQQGNLALARTRFTRSLTLAETLGNDLMRAFVLEGLAQVELEQGAPHQALDHLQASLRLFEALGHEIGVANCLVNYARVATERKQHTAAAQLLAAAGTLYETLEATLAPFDQAEYQHTLKRARTKLPAAAWDAAWRTGQGLSLEQVVQLASDIACHDESLRTTIPLLATGEELTPREVEVLRLLAQGASNQAIAEELVISIHTAKIHVARVLAKLGVATRTEAAVRAHAFGIV